MKKYIVAASLLASCLLLPAVANVNLSTNESVQKQTTKTSDSFAKIQFDTLRANLGTFPANDPIRTTTFYFTNTGTAPLVIHQALASCGCTVPSYSKTPLKPGERGKIEVTYNGTGKFPGHFQKTVTVRTNATTEVIRLSIEGEMTEVRTIEKKTDKVSEKKTDKISEKKSVK